MKIILDSLTRFKPWGEAYQLLEKIELAGKMQYLETYLNDIFDEVTGSELNDYLSFNKDEILDAIGIDPELDESSISKLNSQLKKLVEDLDNDLNEDDFTDKVDVNFDISLYDYGVARNPQNDMTLIGTTPNNEGGYSDYTVMYISLDDVKDVLENNVDDGFYSFVGSTKEDYINKLDNNNLAIAILDINHYNGYWSDQAYYM